MGSESGALLKKNTTYVLPVSNGAAQTIHYLRLRCFVLTVAEGADYPTRHVNKPAVS